MAGAVLADNQKVTKPGASVAADAEIRLLDDGCPFVSRGGIKLAHALDAFGVAPAGRTCLDLGCSTGGFTDCLLQRGAARVHGVDVGRGLLHARLRADPRVTLTERCNARNIRPEDFPGAAFDLVVIDLSFISLRLVLPAVAGLLRAGGGAADVVALVKPQFEASRGEVGKGGIVRDAAVRRRAVDEVARAAAAAGFTVAGETESPITGADGNVEYFLHLRLGAAAPAGGAGDAPPQPGGRTS